LKEAILNCFEPFGTIRNFIPSSSEGKIFLKINGVHYTPFSYTDPDLINGLIELFRNICSNDIFIIENCTSGNFTRLVLHIAGITEVIKKWNSKGVHLIYMDEEPPCTVKLGKDQYEVEIPQIIHDELIKNRLKNVYISLPKLKAHWSTKITLGIKLQLGFLYDQSKAIRHDIYHKQRLVDILELIYPDFCLVDGKVGVARGPTPPARIIDEYIHTYGILFGGTDVVAVDAIGGKLLGFKNLEVETTKIAHERKLGCGDINQIEIVGNENLDAYIKQIPYLFKYEFPKEVKLVEGADKICFDGCQGLTLVALETLYLELGIEKSFSIIYGAGFKKQDLENLKEPILLIGPCAVEDIGTYLRSKYQNIIEVNTCGTLGAYIDAIMETFGVNPFAFVPINPVESMLLYLMAKTKGLKALLPSIPSLDVIIQTITGQTKQIPDSLIQDPEFIEVLEILSMNDDVKIRSTLAPLVCELLIKRNFHASVKILLRSLDDSSEKVVLATLKAMRPLSESSVSRSDPLFEKLKELKLSKDPKLLRIIEKNFPFL